MKDPLRQKWIILWCIWGAAFLLTYCNRAMIQTINRQRTYIEVSNTVETYIRQNRKEITEILNKKATYRQPVESIQIGCLSLKNQLRSLCGAHNLMVLVINSETDGVVSDTVPITLTLVGTYADTLGWLAALERDYPYAPAVQVKVQRMHGQQIPQFQVRIQYQFELAEPQMAG